MGNTLTLAAADGEDPRGRGKGLLVREARGQETQGAMRTWSGDSLGLSCSRCVPGATEQSLRFRRDSRIRTTGLC